MNIVSVPIDAKLHGLIYTLADARGLIQPGHADAVEKLIGEVLQSFVKQNAKEIAEHLEANEQADIEAIAESHAQYERGLAVGRGQTVEEFREERKQGRV